MGAEISTTKFSNNDFEQFKSSLKKETLLLGQWLKDQSFCNEGYSFGAELESWIVDKKTKPFALNEELIKNINNKQVVHELSKFNIEINSDAFNLSNNVLHKIHNNLDNLFSTCAIEAHKAQAQLMLVGTLPQLQGQDLSINSMTDQNRFKAINDQLFNNKDSSEIYITGKDELKLTNNNIMPAAAATSFQIHWKVPVSEAAQIYNASQVASSIVLAISANSPYVLGKELWEESRIPLFEHAISSSPFLSNNKTAKRTGFGDNYISEDIFDYFLKNFLNHSVLLPKDFSPNLRDFSHLKLHNGTIWRWNRPLIGSNNDGTPHIRIEHRVQAAGPSIIDSVANMAFFLGLTHSLTQSQIPMEFQLPFSLAEKNFYRTAKHGLNSKVSWFHGSQHNVKDLILNELLDQAASGLEQMGIDQKDIQKYLYDIMKNRVETGQTGSQWQKKSLDKHHRDFNKMSQDYINNQNEKIPVHKWKI
ncbi:MAG: glutamate--cysteine ligase [Bdellovibrionaceae bacterium]|jgi:gamma-glutamyl:cysteine ligase YbdK (ATP-grasp superfamily)|nr:glutamate--cysteine ligase [Pseudobdellovibrionaceae bacterium]